MSKSPSILMWIVSRENVKYVAYAIWLVEKGSMDDFILDDFV